MAASVNKKYWENYNQNSGLKIKAIKNLKSKWLPLQINTVYWEIRVRMAISEDKIFWEN